MKLRILGQGLTALIFIAWSAPSLAGHIDQDLRSWLKQKPSSSSVRSDLKSVVIYLEDNEFEDRSGLLRSFAIEEEKISVRQQMNQDWALLRSEMRNLEKSGEFLWSSNAIVTQLSRQELRSLMKQKGLYQAVVSDRVITLDKPVDEVYVRGSEEAATYTYGLKMMRAPQAWSMGYDGEGSVVGVIDSGIAFEHPDLQDRVLAHRDFTRDGFTNDRNGHGTHVAGTIAGGNASGTHIGVAPKAKLIIAKVFDNRGSTTLSVLLRAMEWMLDPDDNPDTDDAPRVVSNSWGTQGDGSDFREIVQTWRRFGVFPNFAAGNAGPSWFSMGAPGRFPFSFSVGAVGSDSKIAKFSSRGPVFWVKAWNNEEGLSWWSKWFPRLYTKPEVSAPGDKVLSSIPRGINPYDPLAEYAKFSGTSMATPHVAGLLALILQANPDLSVDQLEDILEQSAADRGSNGNDDDYGFGIVQADVAIQFALQLSGHLDDHFADTDPSDWEGVDP